MRAAQARAFHLQGAPDTPVKINIEVNMGDKIYLGKQWLDVIEVPGHSPGSIALYSPEGGFVVTGDALFNGSIGRTDLAGGDHATLIRSIRSGLLTLPPDTMVYPGHGPSTTIAREINSNPFL
jgi:glyoxylase-like metal-dependent hydrolase (beta-lactamase superfamily II)